MAKRDFMSELARELEEQKAGKRDHIESIKDYTSSHPVQDTEEDFEEPSSIMEEETVEVERPVKKAAPAPRKAAPKEESKELTMDDAYATDSDTPDSFGKEERQKIEKPVRHLRPGAIIALLAILLAIGGLVYYFVFAPKIVVGNFVGNNVSEVSSWAKQNKMESSAIAKKEEYSLDYAKDIVIDQSIEAGEKIKKSTPFTVTVSLGPNPDEEVDFPSDLKSMTMSEIKEWVSEKQLTKTKITTQYSNTVPDGAVISYELKNASESDFKRGSTLNIVCSKGQAPAGQVTVENYVGKTFTELNTWANNKKILLQKQESYSETADSGIVISMDKKAGDTIAEGSTIVVVVSKGKGVKIPNLVGYTKEQLEAWRASKYNTVTVVTKSVYNSAAKDTVIAQNISPGSIVDSGEVLELTISLYLPILETNSREWLGKDYLQLKAWVDDVNSKGASIQAGQYANYQWNICSDEYPTPGTIIDYGCLYGTSDLADGCGRPLNLNSRIAYTVSTGACSAIQIILNASDMKDLNSIQSFCAKNHLSFTIDESPSYLGEGVNVSISSTDRSGDINIKSEFPIVLHDYSYITIHWAQNEVSSTPVPTATPEPTPTPTPEVTPTPAPEETTAPEPTPEESGSEG